MKEPTIRLKTSRTIAIHSPSSSETFTLPNPFFLRKLREHTHDFAELICITAGCGIHIIDDHPTRTRRGD